ncbi:MAG TPA: tRNA glutamyl-Q(34) synthetase GluQRS [Gammaproteobacteria bacterium]|nr:tRNA glutamyl-Q(34) synthetase GluQRS [Gammaproteobacteria bacterium]
MTARTTTDSARYVGRFAPSPTGPLHAGSLLTAVASFLHARQAAGEWLLRIEDVDPPREVAGSAAEIQRALETLKLHWDREVLFQSAHRGLYRSLARRLLAEGRAFRCSCSRSELRAEAQRSPGSPAYPGTCRTRESHAGPSAIRLRVDGAEGLPVRDRLQGTIEPAWLAAQGDYVVERRDGLPAYHLAVVVDDALQGVTTIVRGTDLLESSAVHVHLQRALRLPTPAYYHVPILTDGSGVKLSKQTGAPPLDLSRPSALAACALERLGASPPRELAGADPAELWEWAIEHWRIERLAGVASVSATAA